MTGRTIRLFLEDILHALEKIRKFVAGRTFDSFQADEMLIDAVIRNLEVIGEAARNIPDEVRSDHPSVPWRRIVGLRNILSHRYFGVDLKELWKIATSDVEGIEPTIQELLEELQRSGE
jgi:uncharacterized protein with HEPN domain